MYVPAGFGQHLTPGSIKLHLLTSSCPRSTSSCRTPSPGKPVSWLLSSYYVHVRASRLTQPICAHALVCSEPHPHPHASRSPRPWSAPDSPQQLTCQLLYPLAPHASSFPIQTWPAPTYTQATDFTLSTSPAMQRDQLATYFLSPCPLHTVASYVQEPYATNMAINNHVEERFWGWQISSVKKEEELAFLGWFL